MKYVFHKGNEEQNSLRTYPFFGEVTNLLSWLLILLYRYKVLYLSMKSIYNDMKSILQ